MWLTVSRVGDIHWRLIVGDTQQLALMWMEVHKPLLFPILYHILKFISASLGTDLSIMRQSSVNSLVCDGEYSLRQIVVLHKEQHRSEHSSLCVMTEVTGLVRNDFPSRPTVLSQS